MKERAGEGEVTFLSHPGLPLVSSSHSAFNRDQACTSPLAAVGAVMHRPTPAPTLPVQMRGKRGPGKGRDVCFV